MQDTRRGQCSFPQFLRKPERSLNKECADLIRTDDVQGKRLERDSQWSGWRTSSHKGHGFYLCALVRHWCCKQSKPKTAGSYLAVEQCSFGSSEPIAHSAYAACLTVSTIHGKLRDRPAYKNSIRRLRAAVDNKHEPR